MTTTTPAGWYPDHQGVMRYWDGVAWTAHVAPTAPATLVVRESIAPASAAPPFSQSVAPYAPHPPVYPGPAQYAMAPYAPAPPGPLPNGVGVAGFVVGLVSIFLPLIFGVIGGLVGRLSIVGLSRPYRVRGLAIAGLVLSIFALILVF